MPPPDLVLRLFMLFASGCVVWMWVIVMNEMILFAKAVFSEQIMSYVEHERMLALVERTLDPTKTTVVHDFDHPFCWLW